MTENVVTAGSTGAAPSEVLVYDKLLELSLPEKRKVAEYFDVKLKNNKELSRATHAMIDKAFEESETDDTMYEEVYMQDPEGGLVVVQDTGEPAVTETVVVEDVVAPPVVPVETILVRMTRPNYHYEVMGYTFTKDHPYVLMPIEVAEWVIRNQDGFVQALPSELEEYYD